MANYTLTGLYTNEINLPTGVKQFITLDVTELPAGIPTSVNPRSQNMKSKAVKAMIDALDEHDDRFPFLNNGIKIICKSIKAKGPHSLIINIDDETSQGIVDGGHTYRTIIEYLEAHPNYEKGVYVSVELLYGDEVIRNSVDIAASRNTASTVKLISIMNAQGRFDTIKSIINGAAYADEIVWEENAEGRIKGELPIALMFLFNIEQYARHSGNHPTDSYNSFDHVLKAYNSAWERFGGLSDENIYSKLIKILPKLVELHDYVQSSIPRWYEKAGGRYYQLSKIRNSKKESKTTFYQEEMKYTVPENVVFPILTTARMILAFNDENELIWKFNPIEFFEIVGPSACRDMLKGICEYKDGNKYLKLPSTWKSVYSEARDAFNDAREI